MDINRANLDALFASYLTAWQNALAGVQTMAELAFLVSEFPSSTASNTYVWLDKVPGFREWVGDRVFQNARSQKYDVQNRDFEDSVRISANDIEDDQYGVYTPIIRMMAESWETQKRELIAEWLTSKAASSSYTIFDGKALIADDHAYGSNTIDNKTTSALSASTFEAAFIAAAAWKFSNGKSTMTRFTHLVVGEKLRSTAWHLLKDQYVSDGQTSSVQLENPNKGRVELVVLPELSGTYDDYWFLADCSKSVKPISLQLRKVPAPLMDTDPATVARNGFVDFLADGRAAAAPTFPHLIYGGIVA